MALRSPSSTSRRDLGSRDSRPADSPPPTSQGGSSNVTNVDVDSKTKEEVDHLLAKLQKEGVKIDDKIARIVDDGITRIKANATSENTNEPKRKGVELLLTVVAAAVGFIMGVDRIQKAFHKELAKGRQA